MYEEENPLENIYTTELNGTVYHGSSIDLEDEDSSLIDELRENYNDWDAVWVAEEEHIAKEFSENSNWGNEKTHVNVIYEVEANCDEIAELTFELADELKEYYSLFDLREVIPYLSQVGYNGWQTTGSVDRYTYDDYALFNPSCLQIKAVKFKIDGQWTDYMPMEKGEEVLENLKEKLSPVVEENKVRKLIKKNIREFLREDDDIDWELHEMMDEERNALLWDFSSKVAEHKKKYGCVLIDPMEEKEHPDQLSLFDKDKYLVTPEKTEPYWDCSEVEDEDGFTFEFEGRQPWFKLPIDTIKNVWFRFATTPAGLDIPKATLKTLDRIANTIITNIFKVEANTEFTGHKQYFPDESELEDFNLTREDLEMWYGLYCKDDMTGQMRISDYAMDKLMDKAIELKNEENPHRKLQIIDAIFEIVHVRSDIAGWFVKGGSKALTQLSGYQRGQEDYGMIAENRKSKNIMESQLRQIIRKQIDIMFESEDIKKMYQKAGMKPPHPGKGIHTKKFHSCVTQVGKEGDVDNPYAVCMASLGKDKAVKKSHQRKDEEIYLGGDVNRMDNGMDDQPISQ